MISPRLRDVRIKAGYNYSEAYSNLTDFTSDTNGFSLTYAFVFNYEARKSGAKKVSQNDSVAMAATQDTIIELEAAPEAARYCSASTDVSTPVGMAAKSVIVATHRGGNPNTKFATPYVAAGCTMSLKPDM